MESPTPSLVNTAVDIPAVACGTKVKDTNSKCTTAKPNTGEEAADRKGNRSFSEGHVCDTECGKGAEPTKGQLHFEELMKDYEMAATTAVIEKKMDDRNRVERAQRKPGKFVHENSKPFPCVSSYCKNCVKRIQDYFRGRDLSDNVDRTTAFLLGDSGDEQRAPVVIDTDKDVVLANSILNAIGFHTSESVTMNILRKEAIDASCPAVKIMTMQEMVDNGMHDMANSIGFKGNTVSNADMAAGLIHVIKNIDAVHHHDFSSHLTVHDIIAKNIDSKYMQDNCTCFSNTAYENSKCGQQPSCVESVIKFGEGKSGVIDCTRKNVGKDSNYVRCAAGGIPAFDSFEAFNEESLETARQSRLCLSLCRHSTGCPVNALNAEKLLKCFKLVENVEDSSGPKICTVDSPSKFYTVAANEDHSIYITMGATTLETVLYDRPEISSSIVCRGSITFLTYVTGFYNSSLKPLSGLHFEDENGIALITDFPLLTTGLKGDVCNQWRSKLAQDMLNKTVTYSTEQTTDLEYKGNVFARKVDFGRGLVGGNGLFGQSQSPNGKSVSSKDISKLAMCHFSKLVSLTRSLDKESRMILEKLYKANERLSYIHEIYKRKQKLNEELREVIEGIYESNKEVFEAVPKHELACRKAYTLFSKATKHFVVGSNVLCDLVNKFLDECWLGQDQLTGSTIYNDIVGYL